VRLISRYNDLPAKSGTLLNVLTSQTGRCFLADSSLIEIHSLWHLHANTSSPASNNTSVEVAEPQLLNSFCHRSPDRPTADTSQLVKLLAIERLTRVNNFGSQPNSAIPLNSSTIKSGGYSNQACKLLPAVSTIALSLTRLCPHPPEYVPRHRGQR